MANVVPTIYMLNVANVSAQEHILADTMNDAATLTANATSSVLKNFTTREANISGFKHCTTLYSWKVRGRVLTPSCNIRYELYPFYNQTTIEAPPPPPVLTPPPPPPPAAQGRLYGFISISATTARNETDEFFGSTRFRENDEDVGGRESKNVLVVELIRRRRCEV
ncbi:hypothetical protein REPUB_Repub01dG0061100 [Reevesia pubescens]